MMRFKGEIRVTRCRVSVVKSIRTGFGGKRGMMNPRPLCMKD